MFDLIFLLVLYVSTTSLLCTIVWIIGLAYGKLYWDGSERDCRRFWPPIREWRGWRYAHRYFDLQVHVHEDAERLIYGNPESKGRILYAQYPHGFAPFALIGTGLHGGDKRFEAISRNVRFAAATAAFCVPILREFMLCIGCIDVSRLVLYEYLKSHRDADIAISPGGMREMIRACPGRDDVYLPHVGFIDLAQHTGVDWIIPMFVEGQSDVFLCAPWFLRARDWILTHFCVVAPLLVFPLPLPARNLIHVGKPVRVASEDKHMGPTRAATTIAHDFAESLLASFDGARDKTRLRLWLDRETCVTLEEAVRTSCVQKLFVERSRIAGNTTGRTAQ